MGRHITSGNVATQNLFVRFTVPKKTGRRRKKGSTDSFRFPNEEQNDNEVPSPSRASLSASAPTARDLVRTLRYNPTTYTLQVLGTITQTHRFRTLPDFVFSTKRSPFMTKVRKHIQPFTYEAIKNFAFSPNKGSCKDEDLIPPPTFTNMSLPGNYAYRQNPLARQTRDETGQMVMQGPKRPPRTLIQRVAIDAAAVPTEPDPNLTPVDELGDRLKQLLNLAKQKLEERPIWSRRALENVLREPTWHGHSTRLISYVAYEFRSGPWCNLIVRYGVDPRSDPKYRIFQSIAFQVDEETREKRPTTTQRKGSRRVTRPSDGKNREQGPPTHVFDGVSIALDGKTWQVCDIVEPIIKRLLETDTIREECHLKSDGWYCNGTWAKAKVIMKMKVNAILNDNPTAHDEDIAKLAALPDAIDDSNRAALLLSAKKENMSVLLVENASKLRQMVTASELAEGQPTPRRAGSTRTRQSMASAGSNPAVNVAHGNGDVGNGEDEEEVDAALEEAFDPRIQLALQDFADIDDEVDGHEGSDGERDSGSEHSEDEEVIGNA